ncbi:MAG: surface-adhesin E family protein [Nitrospiraceae bacterium]
MALTIRPFMLILHAWVILRVMTVSPVCAAWVLVDGNENAKVYVDPETIQRKGALVTLWVLDDLQTVHTRGAERYLSSRAQEEHDCREQRFRVRTVANFSGNMGSGKEVYASSAESQWASIPPGTLAQSVWKFACSTRK